MNADDARLRALVDYMALELDGIEKRMTYASSIIMEQNGDDMAALSLYLRDAAAHVRRLQDEVTRWNRR
ncbi:hypothetical protein [Mailhella massiliensis]|uniref:hypothetical protein n=1 Tax=Mailhella massiliensis TaxID=1903261 RepID=UPI00097DE2E9|nr:hypothetical protein [Mailhella massiliensis]